mgnify:CR=1 FL=1
MNTSMLISKLSAKRNGSFISIRWTTDVKLNAAAVKSGHVAYRVTDAVIRKGIKYSSQKSVQAKVEQGAILEHKLPWGEWKTGYEGLLITHKNNDYVRLYLAKNKPNVKYFLDGKEVTLDELKNSGLCLMSQFNKSSERPDALTIKVANIQEIH